MSAKWNGTCLEPKLGFYPRIYWVLYVVFVSATDSISGSPEGRWFVERWGHRLQVPIVYVSNMDELNIDGVSVVASNQVTIITVE